MFIHRKFRGCRVLDGNQNIFMVIRQLLVDRFGLQEEDITPDLHLAEVGADSLDIIELVMEVESKYNIQFSNKQIAEIQTIGEVVNYIEELK